MHSENMSRVEDAELMKVSMKTLFSRNIFLCIALVQLFMNSKDLCRSFLCRREVLMNYPSWTERVISSIAIFKETDFLSYTFRNMNIVFTWQILSIIKDPVWMSQDFLSLLLCNHIRREQKCSLCSFQKSGFFLVAPFYFLP